MEYSLQARPGRNEAKTADQRDSAEPANGTVKLTRRGRNDPSMARFHHCSVRTGHRIPHAERSPSQYTVVHRSEQVPTHTKEALHEPVHQRPSGGPQAAYLASGSGRSWNLMTLLGVPLPPSMWNGARVLTVVQSPLPFHPAFTSSMRPSTHLV